MTELKYSSLEEALALVKSGDTIILGSDNNCPRTFAYNLHTIKDRVENVALFKDGSNKLPCITEPDMKGHFIVNSFFFGADSRPGFPLGTSTFFPTDLCNFARFATSRDKLDIFAVATTPMDENGNFQVSYSLLWETEALKYAVTHGSKVIVEENPNLKRVTGGLEINIKDVDMVLKADWDIATFTGAEPNADEIKIAQNVRSLLKDGDCVQFGIGSLPDAVAKQCMDLKDLGMHSEMAVSGLGEMIRRGVITGERKNINKGEHFFAFAGGDAALFETLSGNSKCHIAPASYVVNPFIIAQNDNMVSINTLIEIDLTGQICSESIGPKQYSGSGGGMDFAYGALMAKGGRGIMAFSSKTAKGISKIKPILTPGAAVTVPRNYVDYVVTENGIAKLSGMTVRERTEALIGLADPAFREELRAEARKLMYI